jgi:Tfp pilus assembly protein PilF
MKQLVEKGGARVEDWYIGLEMLKDHPLVGIGLGNYKVKFLEYRSRFLASERGQDFGGFIPRGAQAHNEYVQFTAEMGIVGLIAIVTSLVILMLNVFNRIRGLGEPASRILGLALAGGVVGYLIHSAVSFPAHLPASSFAFVTFLGVINSGAFGEPESRVELSGITRYLVITLVFAFLVSVTVFAYRDWRANVLMGEGKKQAQYGNYYVAKEKLQKSLSLDFQPRQTYYYLGVTERELGNEKRAIDYFEKSVGRFEPYNLHLQLGTLYQSQGELDKAEESLRTFLSVGAEESLKNKAKYFLSVISIQKNDIERAEKLLDEVLSRDPNFERAIILKGDIANFRGNEAKAREKWREALDVINKKLSRVNNKLSGEIKLEDLSELRSQKDRLTRHKKQVTNKIEEL